MWPKALLDRALATMGPDALRGLKVHQAFTAGLADRPCAVLCKTLQAA